VNESTLIRHDLSQWDSKEDERELADFAIACPGMNKGKA